MAELFTEDGTYRNVPVYDNFNYISNGWVKEIEFNDASILIPKEYRFKDSDKKAYGFIAQEVEKAGYTDIVNTDEETGDKTLDYNSAFAIAIS